jgi:cytochrome P450
MKNTTPFLLFLFLQDTMLIGMFRGMMLDEKFWPNPSAFRPERFLDANGKTFIPENFYPFGVGKHRCMGEMMGRANLFLFITTLFQNFNFLVPEGHDLPSDVPLDGATPSVRKYTALVVRRP